MKILLTTSFILLVFTINAYAQTNQNDAKTLYEKAEANYSSAYRDFDIRKNRQDATTRLDFFNIRIERQADDDLAKVIGLVGSNPKTLYLLIKLKYLENLEKRWLASKDDYNAILKLVEDFFIKVDKKTYPEEKYVEIVNTKKEIESQLQLPQIKNQITFTSKEQAINYIMAIWSDIKYYNDEKKEPNTSEVASMTAKWDGNNIINVFGYMYETDNKYCKYFGAVIDVTELRKKDTISYNLDNLNSPDVELSNIEHQYRSHGYIFPKDVAVSKLVVAGQTPDYKSPKYKKDIQSLQDIYAKVDKKFIEIWQGGDFDIFLIPVLPDRTFDTVNKNLNFLEFNMKFDDSGPYSNDKYFRENAEINYLKAWDYLYANSKK